MTWIQPDIDIPDAHVDDPRIGHLMGEVDSLAENPEVVLVGFPSDEGVRRNGGRPGAAKAPDVIRQQLFRLTPDPERLDAWKHLLGRTIDLGNLQMNGEELAKNQEQLGRLLHPHLLRGTFIIVLGGGHETAYAHFRAYVEADVKTAILNIDAHLDVRPLINGRPHSGSPFRQALEDPHCTGYTICGALRHSTAATHANYIDSMDGRIIWREEASLDSVDRQIKATHESTMLTLDLDALDQSVAPGVSAPAAGGLKHETWLSAVRCAGRNPAITSADICELNPSVDRDDQTARVAAHTIWTLLDGLTYR